MGSGKPGSFLSGDFAAQFKSLQKDVVIIHGGGTESETRTECRAIVQSSSGQFNVDTPIYEGDIVELADPRGGMRRLYVVDVDVVDLGSDPDFGGMSHIRAEWSTRAPAKETAPAQNNAPVIHITGGNAQMAWNNQSVVQTSISASVDSDLTSAIREALEHLSGLPDVNHDELQMAREDARSALHELEADEPNVGVLRRSLSSLRGVVAASMQSAANAASADGARALVASLNLP
ncbi:hypothetical protein [Zhihengliuella halotolerans]|uniref:hypothetical protein n=1 Tax=Zhihengliuella halotolerans TaxID=370736 RepID=UPI000C7FE2CB|nr:hypothetical protein [Zhihengliuella halotolerans]